MINVLLKMKIKH